MDGLKAVPFKEFGFFRKLFSHALIQSRNLVVEHDLDESDRRPPPRNWRVDVRLARGWRVRLC